MVDVQRRRHGAADDRQWRLIARSRSIAARAAPASKPQPASICCVQACATSRRMRRIAAASSTWSCWKAPHWSSSKCATGATRASAAVPHPSTRASAASSCTRRRPSCMAHREFAAAACRFDVIDASGDPGASATSSGCAMRFARTTLDPFAKPASRVYFSSSRARRHPAWLPPLRRQGRAGEGCLQVACFLAARQPRSRFARKLCSKNEVERHVTGSPLSRDDEHLRVATHLMCSALQCAHDHPARLAQRRTRRPPRRWLARRRRRAPSAWRRLLRPLRTPGRGRTADRRRTSRRDRERLPRASRADRRARRRFQQHRRGVAHRRRRGGVVRAHEPHRRHPRRRSRRVRRTGCAEWRPATRTRAAWPVLGAGSGQRRHLHGRRQPRLQRRRPAHREIRRHARQRARPGSRHGFGRTDPLRQRDHQGRDRLRPHPPAGRQRRHAGADRRSHAQAHAAARATRQLARALCGRRQRRRGGGADHGATGRAGDAGIHGRGLHPPRARGRRRRHRGCRRAADDRGRWRSRNAAARSRCAWKPQRVAAA